MGPAKSKRDLSQVNITGHSVDLGPGRGGGPLEGGLQLIRELTFDIDDPGLPYLVTLVVRAQEGRLVCGEALFRQRAGGPPVTGAALRTVTVDSYLKLIRINLSNPDAYGYMVLMREVERTADAMIYDAADEESLLAFGNAQRRRVSKDEMLPRVAAIYRDALKDSVEYSA